MSSEAARLRAALVRQLLETGMVRTARVEAAMRSVPRHVFLPGVPLRQAYANDVVHTKRDAEGVPISAASQPSIVGLMLEQLDVAPGMRILEIGAGTGYNAALLAYLTGSGGQVITIDVDSDIVAGARSALAAAAVANVTVLCGDGALGAPELAPFDRIIATAGVWDLPAAWPEQLAPGGLVVVPLRLRGSVTRSVAFRRLDDPSAGLRSVSSEMCGFMPLRASIASDPRRTIPLTPAADVLLEVQQDQDADPELLAGILQTPRALAWTGVRFADAAPADWLYLWLTCVLPGGLFGISAQPSAAERGAVVPMFRWGTMAAAAGDSLAYLTFRPVTADDGSAAGPAGEPREMGVVGHGRHGAELAASVADRVREWDRAWRGRAATFTIRPATSAAADDAADDAADERAGEFLIRTPGNLITVSWTR